MFQSSPAWGGGSYFIIGLLILVISAVSILSRLGWRELHVECGVEDIEDYVSILSRLGWRELLVDDNSQDGSYMSFNPLPPGVAGATCSMHETQETLSFQSSPAWGGGSYLCPYTALLQRPEFQSSPAWGGGSYVFISTIDQPCFLFQSSPAWGGGSYRLPASGGGRRKMFQSSPAWGGGSYFSSLFTRSVSNCFNPLPPGVAGATLPLQTYTSSSSSGIFAQTLQVLVNINLKIFNTTFNPLIYISP